MLPACYRRAVPPKMRRNFRNRKIASVPVRGPAFRDPKGTSRPSAEGKVSGEGEAGQPLGSRGRRVPVAHKQGADRSGSGDPRPPHASIVPRQSCGTRRSIIVGLRPRQLRFALLQFFLSRERNRTAACGRGRVKTRWNESKCATKKRGEKTAPRHNARRQLTGSPITLKKSPSMRRTNRIPRPWIP